MKRERVWEKEKDRKRVRNIGREKEGVRESKREETIGREKETDI